MFKIDDEVASPDAKSGGVFKNNGEQESPNERTCLRYMMNRNRQEEGC